MRGTALIAVVLAAALAGCGSGEREAGRGAPTPDPKLTTPGQGTPPQPVRPPLRKPSTAAQDALDAGRVAVVDVTGKVAYKPSSLEIAQDAAVTGLSWSRWDDGGATGSGTLTYNSCNPTCANGAVRRLKATVELTAPSQCPGGRFFAASKVTPERGPKPASYLRKPC